MPNGINQLALFDCSRPPFLNHNFVMRNGGLKRPFGIELEIQDKGVRMNSVPLKIRILKYVADQGVVTVQDVMDYFEQWKDPHTVRVTMINLGITQMKYGSLRFGIWFINDKKLIERLRIYYPDLPRYKVRGVSLLTKVPHSLELNKIRTMLEQSDKIDISDWWSEEYIRALPDHKKDGLTAHKVPDAIFWRKRKDGTWQKFYFEYERSLKSPARYGRIFQFYAKRKDVKDRNVIYVCESEQIRDKLVKVEQDLVKGGRLNGVGQHFNFIVRSDFNKAYGRIKKEVKLWIC